MKDYALFYSYKGIGDVLIIIFDGGLSTTKTETHGKVTVIYHEEEIIGYNIFDIKDVVRIRSNGLIYYPSEQFLNVVNSILINEKLPTLEKKEHSGYFIGEILDIKKIANDKSLVVIDSGKEHINAIINETSLSKGNKVVCAQAGTYLNNGQIVKNYQPDNIVINGHICTNRELGMNDEDNVLVLEDDENIGTDFFLLQESL